MQATLLLMASALLVIYVLQMWTQRKAQKTLLLDQACFKVPDRYALSFLHLLTPVEPIFHQYTI